MRAAHGGAPSKIVLIAHEFAPFQGGIATYAKEVARAASEAGYPIEVWAPGLGRYEGSLDGEWPFPIRRLRCGGRLTPWDLARMGREMAGHRKQLEDAVIYLPGIGSQIPWMYLTAAGFFRGQRVVTTFHDVEPLRYGRNGWVRPLAARFFPKVWKISTASHCARKRLSQSFLGDQADRAVVAPCALRADLAALAQPCFDAPLREGEPWRVLTLARIHPRKGQLDTARALSLLPPSIKSRILWQIIGKGDAEYLREVLQTAERGGVSVEAPGEIPLDQMAQAYASCDLYVMTSRELLDSAEGFGMTYLEAAAFAKPSVGYDVGGVSEAVLDGQTGLLLKEADTNAAAQAIERLLTDLPLRRQMGQAARQHAQSFSWKKTASILFSDAFASS